MGVRVIDAAVGSAWAMEEGALVTLFEIAHREHDLSPQALEAIKAGNLDKAEKARVRDGVAILTVEGPLFKRANLMTDLCGATSYDVLMRDLTTAVNDGNVRAILFNVDSPGGEAAGCAELASAILAARGKKPIVAYAGDAACSAAYWLASACDAIFCGPSAALGSIGVRMSLTDTSARDERSGVRRFDFVSSQSPAKISDPKTEDGNARIKARVDAMAQVFVEAVAQNRGVTVAKVLDGFGKGDVLIGSAAVAAGMADGVGTFESVFADLSTSSDPFAVIGLKTAAARGSTAKEQAHMPTEDEMKAAVEAARAEATAAANAAHTAALAAATEKATVDATSTAQAAERDRVTGIHAASFAGYEAERDEAIRSGSTVAAFKAIVVEKEHEKAAARAKAVGSDVDRNAGVPGATKTEKTAEASEGEKAVSAILAAHKLIAG